MAELATKRVRTLTRIWTAIVVLAALGVSEASAQYVVKEVNDDGSGATDTLSWAIQQVNTNGGGSITFNLNGGATTMNITTTSMTGISAAGAVSIDGGGVTIQANGFQAFTVNAGTGGVTFQNMTINGAVAQGAAGGDGAGGGGGGLGSGGAIYVDPAAGNVSTANVTFSNNQAIGGAGGNGDGVTANGGAGGGYNGNAGPNTSPANTTGGAGGMAGTNPANPDFPFNGLPANLGDGNGEVGGYGGGGGGNSTTAANATQRSPGNGGGSGGLSGQGGNGGNGLGGAVFIGNGRTMTFNGGTVIDASNTATGGAGGTGSSTNGTAGPGNGGGLYVGIGSSAVFNNSTTDVTVSGNIYSNGHITITGTGAATVNFFGSTITTTTGVGITVATGTLNGNTASITGTITNSAVLRFTQATTGTFSGSINGSGRVIAAGGGTLIMTGTNSYSGGTSVVAGTVLQGDTRNLQGAIDNDSNLIFNQNFTGTYGGVITGNGSVTKSGTGSLTYSAAQTYSGPTTIDQGTLTANNALNGDVYINTAGTFRGTGTVNGDLQISGTYAPGNNGIGTQQVNGLLTSNVSSTTLIDFNGTGTTPGVNGDRINATDVVLNGGTVAIQSTTSVGLAGLRYRFLQGTNSLVGAYDGATFNNGLFTASLEYDYTNFFVEFVLARAPTNYAALAQTENQRQVGAYLDTVSGTANGDLGNVIDQFNLLTPSQARDALDQMSGFGSPSAASVKMLLNNFMFQKIAWNSGLEGEVGSPRNMYGEPVGAAANDMTDVVLVGSRSNSAGILPVYRIQNRRRPVWNSWTTAYGAFASGGTIVGDFSSLGNITSLYRYLNDIVKFGVVASYNYVDVGTNVPNQAARTNDYQFGSYFRADDGVSHALLAYTAGLDDIRTRRTVQFAGIDRVAVGNTNGWQNTLYTEIGRRFPVAPIDVQPFLALQYTYLRQNGYQETGAGALNLNTGGIDGNALYGLLGSRFLYDGLGGVWDFHAAWLHNYLDPRVAMPATFAGTGGAGFTTRGLDLGNDSALVGGGANWAALPNLNLALNYDAYIANNTVFSYASGSIQYRW